MVEYSFRSWMTIVATATEKNSFAALSFAALGIVYGDIGTSPLYAMRESMGNLPITVDNVLGILSLIFWALMIIISGKYLTFVFRADNNGEGGILALLASLRSSNNAKDLKIFFVIGIFGAGLMLGDGMLTPAISVTSAIEGINIVTPALSHAIIPLVCLVLLVLFFFQSRGTNKIGFSFAPIIAIWFLILAVLGMHQIDRMPIVLRAINPFYAFHFFIQNGWRAYTLLGSVFLVLTGGEALYADLGHFGKNAIRISWFCIVLPGLLLNYFGQAALLLAYPAAIVNPFYLMAPNWFEIPLVIIATLATIIASQAVISATFSLIKQAILLGLYPRLPIVQTSATKEGQIYIPQVNFLLALGTLLLVIIFQTSAGLTHAYGIAVNFEMVLTTLLVTVAAIKLWRWSPIIVFLVFGLFLFIELAFLGANLEKIITGGWVPLLFALVCAFVMYTWNKGMRYLKETYYPNREEFSKAIKKFHDTTKKSLPNITGIFIADLYDQNGGSFLRYLDLSHSLPEHILIVNYEVENIPYVKTKDRFTVICLDKNVCQITLHYGFMDFISIPQSLYLANERGLLPFKIQLESTSYFIEVTNIIASSRKRTLWFNWQEKLFAFLMRNYASNLNIEFYRLPYDRTVAIGAYCVI